MLVSPPRHHGRRIEEFIESHLDRPLNVDELAASEGISISHFSRCFRDSVGLTPHSYVMRRRLLRAQDLLLGTNMAISEVALSTGFSDVISRENSISPWEYRPAPSACNIVKVVQLDRLDQRRYLVVMIGTPQAPESVVQHQTP
jgi:Helix-turn-helix domain